jgi:hypothetical protein
MISGSCKVTLVYYIANKNFEITIADNCNFPKVLNFREVGLKLFGSKNLGYLLLDSTEKGLHFSYFILGIDYSFEPPLSISMVYLLFY